MKDRKKESYLILDGKMYTLLDYDIARLHQWLIEREDWTPCVDAAPPMYASLQSSVPYPTAIENVIFNDPATIVFWNDGTKTVVKVHKEPYDPEKGLAMAISKKFIGSYHQFKKWLPKEEKTPAPEPPAEPRKFPGHAAGKNIPENRYRRMAHRRELYDTGMSDSQIAKIQNVLPSTIADWRRKNSLPSHEQIRRVKPLTEHGKLMEERRNLYSAGLLDAEIAKMQGVGANAIQAWRKRHGLPINKKEEACLEKGN